MIRLQPKPTFMFNVEIAVPGSEEPARFKLTGKHMGQAALSAWADRAKDMQGRDAEFLSEVITDWTGVTGEDGKAVKFDKDSLATLVDAYPGSGLQIFSAYIKELSAGRGKNS